MIAVVQFFISDRTVVRPWSSLGFQFSSRFFFFLFSGISVCIPLTKKTQ